MNSWGFWNINSAQSPYDFKSCLNLDAQNPYTFKRCLSMMLRIPTNSWGFWTWYREIVGRANMMSKIRGVGGGGDAAGGHHSAGGNPHQVSGNSANNTGRSWWNPGGRRCHWFCAIFFLHDLENLKAPKVWNSKTEHITTAQRCSNPKLNHATQT